MSDRNSTAPLEAQAARYFRRAGFSAPAFLDADRLAILDDRTGVPQVSVLSLADGEVTPVTTFGERVLTMLASSTTGQIVFGMDEGGNENQQLWRVQPGDDPHRLTPQSSARHEPDALSKDGRYVYFRSNARDIGAYDVERLDLTTGVREILLEAPGQPFGFEPSADGTRLLMTRLNGNLDGDLLELDFDSGVLRNLTPHEGEAEIFAAKYATSGDGIWVSTNEQRNVGALYRFSADATSRELIVDEPWDVEAASPSPDGVWLAISVNDDGASRLSLVKTDDPSTRIAIDAPWGTFDRFTWAPDSSKVAFGFSTPDAPSAIYLADLSGATTVVAKVEEEDVPPTVVPELIHFTTFDGREIPAFWFVPEGEGPFPVIVDIHGGPESQRRLNYQPIDEYLVSLGFAVLATNVRGSSGYGKEYVHLDDVELRLDSVTDAAYAVDWLKAREDVADDQIIVMGQSYGGFMTLASLCFHPDRWAAGFDIVGIANFVTFMERTGAWRRKHREAEYGSLEHHRDVLERISPLNHVEHITAPLFLIHGRNDPRVPLFEAEQIHDALKERGRTVELRVFDDEGHGLSKRKNRIVGYAAAAEFLLRQIGREATIAG